MSAPTTIVYHGQRYVLADGPAAPHQKCPNGQHWNVYAKECQKIDENHNVNEDRASARSWGYSERARQATNAAGTGLKGHQTAAEEHRLASIYHKAASKEIRQSGFHDLAAHHENRAAQHTAQQQQHEAKAAKLLQKAQHNPHSKHYVKPPTAGEQP